MDAGERCSNITDCNPGLYCNLNSVCTAYKKTGDPCTYDDECGRSALCHFTDVRSMEGKCIEMFSIVDGNSVGTNYGYEYIKGRGLIYVMKDREMLCISGYSDIKGICRNNDELPVSLRKGKRCLTDSQCPTTVSNVFGKCSCGFNRYKSLVCGLVAGDDEWVKAREAVKVVSS
jgi:hypothetical protein